MTHRNNGKTITINATVGHRQNMYVFIELYNWKTNQYTGIQPTDYYIALGVFSLELSVARGTRV